VTDHSGPFDFGHAHLWAVDALACAEALAALDDDEKLVPDRDRERINATTPASSLTSRLTAHRAFRVILRATFGETLRATAIDAPAHGKPTLPGLRGDFSLSHCPSGALIGLARNGVIGVDIEAPRPVRIGAERIAKIEQTAVTLAGGVELPGSGDPRALQAWVRLEAVAKTEGLGMARLLTLAGALGGAGTPTGIAHLASRLTAHDLPLDGGFTAAVSRPAGEPRPAVTWLPASREGLLSLFMAAARV
jgi:hypothetical protein